MHRPLVARVALVATAGLLVSSGVGAAVAAAARKPPVDISGEVNEHGKKKAKGGEIDIKASGELYFSPTYVKVPKGVTSVEVNLTGKGTSHTFTIDGTDVDVDLDPGDTATVTVPVGDGNLVFYCRIHRSFGMQGAFFHKKGVTTSTSGGSGSDDSGGSGGSGGSSGDDSGGGGIDYGY